MSSINNNPTPMQRPSMSWKGGPHGGKIDPLKAQEIRALLSMGYPQHKIAARYGVTQQCISKFKTGYRKT
jgi:DNA invertase Pin-like site-specific DNA recombinase